MDYSNCLEVGHRYSGLEKTESLAHPLPPYPCFRLLFSLSLKVTGNLKSAPWLQACTASLPSDFVFSKRNFPSFSYGMCLIPSATIQGFPMSFEVCTQWRRKYSSCFLTYLEMKSNRMCHPKVCPWHRIFCAEDN